MADLSFRDPAFLWLLLLVPALGAWLWRERKHRHALKFPVTHVIATMPKGWRARLMWLPPALVMAAVALVAVGLARPQLPTHGKRESTVEGIDLAVALDLSSSMQATDLKPKNRIQVAKQVLTNFLSARGNDRVSLVVFSGAAYTQAPLTLDHAALKQSVAQLEAGTLHDGTAIGDAIGVSLNRLRDSTAKSRAVVLLTDGDNNAGRLSPEDASKLAQELRIPVFPILIGKGGLAQMPVGKTAEGEVVWDEVEAPVDEALLQRMADDTGGAFYRATDGAALESGLASVLNKMERSKLTDGGATSQAREQFAPLLLAALALAAADLFLRSTLLRVMP